MGQKQWKLYKVTRFTQKEQDEFICEMEKMREAWANAMPYAEKKVIVDYIRRKYGNK